MDPSFDGDWRSSKREPGVTSTECMEKLSEFFDLPFDLIECSHQWNDMVPEPPPPVAAAGDGELRMDFGSWDDDFFSHYENGAPADVPSNCSLGDGGGGGGGSEEVGSDGATAGRTLGGRWRLSSSLDFEEISSHFYLPITQAAKEMKVGLTVLKKRCRELGISRWPHRKMKSLSSLIHHVQELTSSSGEPGEMRLMKAEIERLDEHRRLMERRPELQLSEETKKLRQACFKANYKRRKLMSLPSCN